VGKNLSSLKLSRIFTRFAMPAEGNPCPMRALPEPMVNGSRRSSSASSRPIDSISVASPVGVPVAWTSR